MEEEFKRKADEIILEYLDSETPRWTSIGGCKNMNEHINKLLALAEEVSNTKDEVSTYQALIITEISELAKPGNPTPIFSDNSTE